MTAKMRELERELCYALEEEFVAIGIYEAIKELLPWSRFDIDDVVSDVYCLDDCAYRIDLALNDIEAEMEVA